MGDASARAVLDCRWAGVGLAENAVPMLAPVALFEQLRGTI